MNYSTLNHFQVVESAEYIEPVYGLLYSGAIPQFYIRRVGGNVKQLCGEAERRLARKKNYHNGSDYHNGRR